MWFRRGSGGDPLRLALHDRHSLVAGEVPVVLVLRRR
jgi:hypothetical protein